MSFPQTTAHILLETDSVAFRPAEPFTLTSGKLSPVYVDCRRVISFPRARAALMDMAVDLLTQEVGYEAFDVVAGGESAGIPYAAWLAERLMLPMLYVRKQAKGFGRQARIEGTFEPGARALLVEDLATDGGTKLDFIHALREAGARVEHCFVVFHYGIFPQSVTALKDEGVKLHWLATWDDVVTEAERAGFLATDLVHQVRRYLADPEAWAPA
jgi:orotate phosphoribosyltransferase